MGTDSPSKSVRHAVDSQTVCLVVEGGIGDVLTSFSAMKWIKAAYPSKRFIVLAIEHSPGRAAGMVNVAETHPDVSAVFAVRSLEHATELLGGSLPFTLNISPWHFLTNYYRAMHPQLDYRLTEADNEAAKKLMHDLRKPLLIFQSVASNPKINWPLERWRNLAELLSRRYTVALVGGPGEGEIPAADVDIRGKFTVRQTLAFCLQAAGAVTARSFISIVTMDAGIPTVVITPPVRLHEIRDYAYPPSYFENGSAQIVHSGSPPERVAQLIEDCIAIRRERLLAEIPN